MLASPQGCLRGCHHRRRAPRRAGRAWKRHMLFLSPARLSPKLVLTHPGASGRRERKASRAMVSTLSLEHGLGAAYPAEPPTQDPRSAPHPAPAPGATSPAAPMPCPGSSALGPSWGLFRSDVGHDGPSRRSSHHGLVGRAASPHHPECCENGLSHPTATLHRPAWGCTQSSLPADPASLGWLRPWPPPAHLTGPWRPREPPPKPVPPLRAAPGPRCSPPAGPASSPEQGLCCPWPPRPYTHLLPPPLGAEPCRPSANTGDAQGRPRNHTLEANHASPQTARGPHGVTLRDSRGIRVAGGSFLMGKIIHLIESPIS